MYLLEKVLYHEQRYQKVAIKDLYISQNRSHCAFFEGNKVLNHNFLVAAERLHNSAICKKITNVITVFTLLLFNTQIFSNNVT